MTCILRTLRKSELDHLKHESLADNSNFAPMWDKSQRIVEEIHVLNDLIFGPIIHISG